MIRLTPFGTVRVSSDAVVIVADHAELYAWSHRPGAAWPCSTLDDCGHLVVTFDRNGLCDMAGTPPERLEEIAGDELSAWSSDVLRDVLPQLHPCWLVCVGQFSGASC